MKVSKVFSLLFLMLLLCLSNIDLKAQGDWNLFSTGNDIKAISRQGVYLWLGTNGGGLVKFNTSSAEMEFFTKENSDIPDMVVNDIRNDGTDNIWVATNNGLAYYNGTDWTIYKTSNSGIPSDVVRSIDIDGNGVKWVATDAGIAELSGRNWIVYNTGNSDIPSDNAVQLRVKPTGSKWICTDNGLARFDEVVWTIYNTANSDLPSNMVESVDFDEAGLGVLIGTNQGVAFLTGSDWTIYNTGNSNLPSDEINDIFLNSGSGIWVATQNGIAKFQALDWVPFNSTNSDISNDFVNTLVVDNDDNIWLGTVDSLNKFRDTVWTKFFINKTLLETNFVLDVKTDAQGWSWFATLEGLASYNGAHWEYYEATRPYECYSLAFDEDGNLWAATDSGAAKFVNGVFELFNTSNSPIPSNMVIALTFDVFNNLWLGTSNGLAKYNGSTWSVWNTGNSDLPSNFINYLVFEGNTKCWIGTSGGLAMFNSIDWTVYNTGNSDIPDDNVTSIQVDSNNDKWIGTLNGGLSFFPDTAFYNFNTNNSELVSDRITRLRLDLNGDLWIGTLDQGIMLKSDSVWTAWNIDNSALPFQGIMSLFADLGNNIWIGTPSGAAVFNRDGITPSVHITYSDSSVCAGNNIKVVFRNLFGFNTGNRFTVELSDANGNFDNPITIGTKNSTSLQGKDSIICLIPAHLQSGNGFRVRVRASNPAVLSKDNGFDIMIRELPQPEIRGKNVVCFGATETYSAPWQHNITFFWKAVNGTIIGDSTTNVVTIEWSNSARTGLVVLVQSNELGCTDSAVVNVEILGHPQMSISGPKKVCAGIEYIYTADTSRNIRYWSATGGKVISMPAYNKVIVVWTAQEYGRLKLVEVTPGNCEDSLFYEVTIQPTPTADISGDTEVRVDEVHEYVTEQTSSDITKKWYVVNGEIIGDDDGDTLTVKWIKGNFGAVIQSQKTEAGCADSNIITVRIFEHIAIDGTRNVCEGVSELYEANRNLGAYAQWIVSGGEIQGSSSNRVCLIKWGTPGTGIIKLIQWVPNTSYRDTIDVNVNINETPDKPTITEYLDTLISSAPVGNQWFLNGQLIPGATAKKYYTYQVQGNYTVQVTIARKCTSPLSNVFSFISDVEEQTKDDAVEVFPNPSAGEFTLNINTDESLRFTFAVYNILGQKVLGGGQIIGGLHSEKIDMQKFPAGIYHLFITLDGKEYQRKLILSK